jgi:hypothetical protein
MQRRLILFMSILATAQAEPLTIDQLFTRPYLWGTAPEQLKWSKQNHTLVFLWNPAGRRFLDVYAYRPDGQRLVRLTDLESQRDELTASIDEKDPHRNQNPMPAAGVGAAFDVARDGSRVAFTYRGDVYLASTSDAAIPLRLTRTKAAESAPEFSLVPRRDDVRLRHFPALTDFAVAELLRRVCDCAAVSAHRSQRRSSGVFALDRERGRRQATPRRGRFVWREGESGAAFEVVAGFEVLAERGDRGADEEAANPS